MASKGEDDENKLDFKLLVSKKSAELQPPDLTSPNLASEKTPFENEVWPLQLTTSFVDHYILGDVVGNGSYAEVRECINTRDLTRCAVKVVDMSYLRRQSPTALANQRQEIKLLRRLKHPNVIEMLECLVKHPKIYIILEYCPFVLSDLLDISEVGGKDFIENNSKNQLPINLARNLFIQLLEGLNYLHSASIVHRDIKPQNILLSTCGQLKIIDFGVSQVLSNWSQSDLCANYEGSPLFQAPEVVSGQSEYAGFKVDVWSAGVTLYLIVFSCYPFYDDALLGLYDKILSEPLEMPKLNKDDGQLIKLEILNDLLEMMLDKEASRRCSIDEALKHPWLKLSDISIGTINTISTNADDDDDSAEVHSEFIDLLPKAKTLADVKGKQSKKQEPSSLYFMSRQQELDKTSMKQRDIYLSMSVLPYLYNHHFSHLPIFKANKPPSVSSNLSNSSTSSANSTNITTTAESTITSNTNSTNASPSVSPKPAAEKSLNPSSTTAFEAAPVSVSSQKTTSDPHELISDQEIEWGTERQYKSMKIPLIRANRIRPSSNDQKPS